MECSGGRAPFLLTHQRSIVGCTASARKANALECFIVSIKLRTLTSCIALVGALAFSVSAHAITYDFTQATNGISGSPTTNVGRYSGRLG